MNLAYCFSQVLAEKIPVNRFPCPAKLNLFLYINGRRADGYHELQTLFQFLDYGDWLNINLRNDGQINLQPELENLPTEQNLIFRAAKLLQQTTQCQQGADLYLEKILPQGGGLGGGSSNAATTLVALNYLWKTGLSIEQLAKLGLQLGADVPVFIQGYAAFAEGVGEKLTECTPPEKYYLVLKPNTAIATAQIFQAKGLPRNTPKRPLSELLCQKYSNDCEKIVREQYSEVELALNWLIQYAPARLTGTGACVFAEFNSKESAKTAYTQKPAHWEGFIAQGQNRSPLYQYLDRI